MFSDLMCGTGWHNFSDVLITIAIMEQDPVLKKDPSGHKLKVVHVDPNHSRKKESRTQTAKLNMPTPHESYIKAKKHDPL